MSRCDKCGGAMIREFADRACQMCGRRERLDDSTRADRWTQYRSDAQRCTLYAAGESQTRAGTSRVTMRVKPAPLFKEGNYWIETVRPPSWWISHHEDKRRDDAVAERELAVALME